MPQTFEIKRLLSCRSDRVKSMDIHPVEPWICCALYNGNVHIWNTETASMIKTFEVCTLPVRAVRFVARMNWILTGSDDLQLRVFNYNTLERVHQFEAHADYIRDIIVHDTQPFVLTSSDDMVIRLWNWKKKWSLIQTYEGHTHYVMEIALNPKDQNTFASASLDRTIKVWGLGGSCHANFTLEGHEKGVNCVDYYTSSDKPYLVSGSDDRTVKIWDYQTKSCVQTLSGHAANVTAVAFHPELPVALSGSEDGTVRIWHTSTYRLESTLNYGLERVWKIRCAAGKRLVGIGYDEGTVVISLGREEPVMSMDATGKLVCARHTELVQANLRQLTVQAAAANNAESGEAAVEGSETSNSIWRDGERLPVSFRQMGACEIYPATMAHNANGCFVSVCGDGEYIVYTAMALRNKAFGRAQQFVWSSADPAMYAVRESSTVVRVFKSFKEMRTFKLDFGAESIFGGLLLGARSVAGLSFFDWETGQLVRRIEVASVNHVFWGTPSAEDSSTSADEESDEEAGGTLVAICTQDNFYILRYNPKAVAEAAASGRLEAEASTGGLECAFQVVKNGDISETVTTGCWYGDAFLYTNSVKRLRYYVGGELVTVAHLDRPMYILGYLSKANRVFLGDRELNVVSYRLLGCLLEYETAVMRGDLSKADSLLPSIPSMERTRLAQFLEKQGYKAQALRVTGDAEHRFELAISLNQLDMALEIANELSKGSTTSTVTADEVETTEDGAMGLEHKWRQLADLASQQCRFDLAQECLSRIKDHASLLLLATSSGNADWLKQLANQTTKENKSNIAFLAQFLLGDLDTCIQLLVDGGRLPEAVFFARTYQPSKVPELVDSWRAQMAKAGQRTKYSESLANPRDYPNLFPGYAESLKAEKWLEYERKSHANQPASDYLNMKPLEERDVLLEMQSNEPANSISDHSRISSRASEDPVRAPSAASSRAKSQQSKGSCHENVNNNAADSDEEQFIDSNSDLTQHLAGLNLGAAGNLASANFENDDYTIGKAKKDLVDNFLSDTYQNEEDDFEDDEKWD